MRAFSAVDMGVGGTKTHVPAERKRRDVTDVVKGRVLQSFMRLWTNQILFAPQKLF